MFSTSGFNSTKQKRASNSLQPHLLVTNSKYMGTKLSSVRNFFFCKKKSARAFSFSQLTVNLKLLFSTLLLFSFDRIKFKCGLENICRNNVETLEMCCKLHYDECFVYLIYTVVRPCIEIIFHVFSSPDKLRLSAFFENDDVFLARYRAYGIVPFL